MPYTIQWLSPNDVWVKFDGILRFADTLNATNDVYNDLRADHLDHAYWDFSAIDDFKVSEREVEEMASMDHSASLYMRPLRSAFVIQKPELRQLGEEYIGLMLTLGSPWQNKLFETMESARRWMETPAK